MLNLYKNQISFEKISNFFCDFEEKKNRIGQILIKENLDEETKKKYLEKNKLLQNEFIYIYKITGLYDLNMNIIIPEFKEIDLIHIFFTFEDFNKFYLGPAFDGKDFLNNENLYDLYENIKKEIKNLNNFEDIAAKISIMFYKYLDKEIEIPEIINAEKIKECIQYKIDNIEQNSEIQKKLEVLIEIIDLGFYFDNYKKYKENKEKNNDIKLTFDDFKCLKDEFNINSIKNIKNFPSFQYFLLNNYDNIQYLLKIVKKENINKLFEPNPVSFIPFWVFIIRIMSSTNCLIYEDNKNPFEKEFTNIIRNKILSNIENKLIIDDLSWINLITENKFENIFDKNINMFYIFFNKICSNISFNNDNINFIRLLLKDFYQSLFEICLNQKFNELLNTDINSNKFPFLNLVKNPKNYIKNFINKKLSSVIKKQIEQPNFLNFSRS